MDRIIKTVCIFLCGVAISPASERPNIVLIFADDVGTDAIGCYGGQSYPTPNIDALAAGGMKFDHGYAMPVCHPSRICLMTGHYPFRYGAAGMKWGSFPKAAEGKTIADHLKGGGYKPAVAGKWQLCMMKDDLKQPRRLGFDEWLLFGWHEGGRYHDPLLYENGKRKRGTETQYGPDLYTNFLIDFMKRSHEAGKPFFAYYPMALCHDVTDDLNGRQVAFYKDKRWMTFAEMVSSMDDMVGRMIAALADLGIRRDTLVIFTTDNGSPRSSYFRINEAGKMLKTPVFSIRNGKVVPGGKGRMDDTGTRVPLIASWPGMIEPRSTASMVDLTDLLPTFAEVANLPTDTMAIDGRSYAPVLFGKPRPNERSWIFLEHRGKKAVRSANFKLRRGGRFFDLRSDPLEENALDVEQLSELGAAEFERLSEALAKLKQHRGFSDPPTAGSR